MNLLPVVMVGRTRDPFTIHYKADGKQVFVRFMTLFYTEQEKNTKGRAYIQQYYIEVHV